jgi:hypothetical protein
MAFHAVHECTLFAAKCAMCASVHSGIFDRAVARRARTVALQRSKADGGRKKNPFASKCERVKAESADEPSLPIGLGAWQGAGSVRIRSSIQNLERLLGNPPPFPVAPRLIGRPWRPCSNESTIHVERFTLRIAALPCATEHRCVLVASNEMQVRILMFDIAQTVLVRAAPI